MREVEKIELSDQETIDLMSKVTFNLGAIMLDIRSALGRYNDLPELKEKNEKNIIEKITRCEKGLEKLRTVVELLRDKTNYSGVEEVLEIENQIIKLLTPLIDQVKRDPFKYAKEWRTGSGLDISSEFERVDLVVSSFQNLELFERYTQLVDNTKHARKNIEESII